MNLALEKGLNEKVQSELPIYFYRKNILRGKEYLVLEKTCDSLEEVKNFIQRESFSELCRKLDSTRVMKVKIKDEGFVHLYPKTTKIIYQ